MLKKNILMMSAAMLLATGTAHPALAETMSMEDMQKQLEALSKQVEKLSAIVEEQNKTIAQQSASLEGHDAKLMEQQEKISQASSAVETLTAIAPAAGSGGESNVKITMKPMPKIESADGLYSFQPFGRVHMDYTFFDDDRQDHPDSVDFRRARLGFKGALGEDFGYKFEMDFAREGVAFKEVTLSYEGFEFADFTIGHFKPYFGMQQNVSSNYLQFLERAAPTNALTRDEELGFGFNTGADAWSLALGVFNEDGGNNNAADDEARTIDGRGTVALVNTDDVLLHAGAGASYRVPTARTESVTYAARVTGVGNNLVSTGAMAGVDHELVYNAELAGVMGPASFMGEYIISTIERDGSIAASDPEFDGWYAQAGYFLTGESRPYSGNEGTFGRIEPIRPFSLENGTWGAWEIVGRYETLDLDDAGAGVTGGELEAWTAGVNWHLTPYIRLMTDYISVDTGANAVVPDDKPDIINVRAQWDF